MDPREQKAIMSQGAIRPETPRDREERRILEAELATSPVRGEPLEQRLRNFRPDADAAIRALGGPAAREGRGRGLCVRRVGASEDELARHEAQLAEAWRELAEATRDAAAFEHEWREIAR